MKHIKLQSRIHYECLAKAGPASQTWVLACALFPELLCAAG